MAVGNMPFFARLFLATQIWIGNRTSNWTLFSRVMQWFDLGKPVAKDDDLIVVSAVLANNARTIAAQPDVCRNLIFTHTTDTVTDTLPTAAVVGSDINGIAQSETVTILADQEVSSAKCYGHVDSITLSGWVIGGANADLLKVGVGNKIGLPVAISAAAKLKVAMLDGVTRKPDAVAHGGSAGVCSVDLNTGTYANTKTVLVGILG